ncbi:MAG: 50S ribosomal protein L24 [Erysipelotrichaceae bacterium]
MKILKGDKVKVITGKYKGTIGEVTQVFPKKEMVVVEGVNMIKKSLKPTQANPDGGIIEKEAPIHVSNVMAYDSKAKKSSRIGYVEEKGNKVRVYKSTGNKVKGGKK